MPPSGTVNRIFRIGDDLAARFRLRPGDPDAVEAELRAERAAAEQLAASCPVPVPRVVALGSPGHGYPLPWSVQTWLPGRTVTSTSCAGSQELAEDLAALVAALRRADTGGRSFSGPGRGGSLPRHDGWVEQCLAESRQLLDVGLLRELWQGFRELPAAGADVMSHTDLIPANLLTDGRRLTGVLDVGDSGPADPALDLVAGWHVLDARPRARFRELLGCGDVEWRRGAAWAFEQALGAFWCYLGSNPTMAELGAWTLHRVVAAETGQPHRLAPPASPVWRVLGL
nr:phosphotransferase [Auraticoccus cholistanensis]